MDDDDDGDFDFGQVTLTPKPSPYPHPYLTPHSHPHPYPTPHPNFGQMESEIQALGDDLGEDLEPMVSPKGPLWFRVPKDPQLYPQPCEHLGP